MVNPDLHESHDLIASDKVVGTTVYDMNGENVGSIERIILEKRGGRVAYAVMSFGGILGIGHEHYPLPWEMLDYDTSLGGFQVNITKEQVEGAPRYPAGQNYDWSPESGRRVYDYYGIAPYWV
ncbi:PRC-barrel domain containing protein [Sinorhizobium medicae]|uniref:PRC-barrel domain-containing protein n=1 Tax=Sinorhizobium medicae TaxID=110321 RepID=UPI000FDC32C7|nr:PRC-barrel domain-containing protein [Sinorhizobium medicae]MDX0605084.1 PRC-barrel domain containing protein [Sinorhizobium medicae]MDX0820954.1 PRC-barrel domain containing protein [Sinorhizobium medicae]MDX0863944.1 PRC-barrel domain containing protein [Sinorhizobium medicae]RVJ24151.1 PRC-barrel domain containing protein [Sinorhizobium medicae]